jgi:hypothetical protein
MNEFECIQILTVIVLIALIVMCITCKYDTREFSTPRNELIDQYTLLIKWIKPDGYATDTVDGQQANIPPTDMLIYDIVIVQAKGNISNIRIDREPNAQNVYESLDIKGDGTTLKSGDDYLLVHKGIIGTVIVDKIQVADLQQRLSTAIEIHGVRDGTPEQIDKCLIISEDPDHWNLHVFISARIEDGPHSGWAQNGGGLVINRNTMLIDRAPMAVGSIQVSILANGHPFEEAINNLKTVPYARTTTGATLGTYGNVTTAYNSEVITDSATDPIMSLNEDTTLNSVLPYKLNLPYMNFKSLKYSCEIGGTYHTNGNDFMTEAEINAYINDKARTLNSRRDETAGDGSTHWMCAVVYLGFFSGSKHKFLTIHFKVGEIQTDTHVFDKLKTFVSKESNVNGAYHSNGDTNPAATYRGYKFQIFQSEEDSISTLQEITAAAEAAAEAAEAAALLASV